MAQTHSTISLTMCISESQKSKFKENMNLVTRGSFICTQCVWKTMFIYCIWKHHLLSGMLKKIFFNQVVNVITFVQFIICKVHKNFITYLHSDVTY